ncbi:MAG: hypothetical protein MUP66_01740 [Candidatus Nanohaloarchaeota archaeon QJJ-5]|nr:hypothetical protein [Candidatus Nanohaloarchaeota archaeon QJJ-5]
MNIKVLTAVFITLFGISVGMSQGALSVDDLTNVSGLTDKIGDAVSPLFERSSGDNDPTDDTGTEANKTFVGTFSTDTAVAMTITSSVQLSFEGQASVDIGGLETDTATASLTNFTGDVDLGENASISGDVDELVLDDSSFTADDRRSVSMTIESLESVQMDEYISDSLTFENVTGDFETDVGSFTYDEKRTLTIDTFEGTMTISDGEIELDGVVQAASIGDMSLGG